MLIPLSKPFKYEEYDLTEIDLDFEGAPANVLIRADREMVKRKHVPQFKQMDTVYCGVIASMVTKIPYKVLTSLPLKDFNLLVNAVSGFLLSSEEVSVDTEEETELT